MQTDSKPTSSFFDDDEVQTQFLFKKVDEAHMKLTEVAPTITGNLIKQKPGEIAMPQQTTFALHDKTIVKYQYGSLRTPETFLDISHARLKEHLPDANNPHYGFSLTKNGNTYQFFSPEKETIENWINSLKNICILTQFHNEYKAIKMIGKGSFAKVYLVESKTSRLQYAVKSFVKESVFASSKQNAKPSMLNEIDIMRALNHDNIIKLYEVYETEKSIYLVIELIEGKPLQDILTRPSFRNQNVEARTTKIIFQILDALSYLASKGIMHRDLKPDNILIDKNDKVKIADFGLATYVDVPEYIFKKCGTPGYIAPEVLKYDQKNPRTHYNHQCDVFSAGCILFYMLFGRPFFDGRNASEILLLNRKFNSLDSKSINVAKAELSKPTSKIPREGINLVIQLLDFDVHKRITAADAKPHFYFSSMQTDSFESLDISSEESTPVKRGSFMAEHTLTNRRESIAGPVVLPRDRFAQRDSLYLDMGRPDYLGKMDTLVVGSQNNSMLFAQRRHSSNESSNGSLSSFNKTPLLPDPKKRSSVKGFGMGGGGSQSVLKAAIFRNMQKNNEEEGKEDMLGYEEPQDKRKVSDASNHNSSFDSDIAGDICQEEPQVESHVRKLKAEAVTMVPSRKAHLLGPCTPKK